MSKYIKLYDAIMAMAEWFSEPITPTQILSDLPTIEVSEDCISREWLETNFQTVCENVRCNECPFNSDDCRLIEFIVDAPSVVPSRPEGEWVHIAGSGYRCSNCNEYTKSEKPFHKPKGNYCPNCGAKMKG